MTPDDAPMRYLIPSIQPWLNGLNCFVTGRTLLFLPPRLVQPPIAVSQFDNGPGRPSWDLAQPLKGSNGAPFRIQNRTLKITITCC